MAQILWFGVISHSQPKFSVKRLKDLPKQGSVLLRSSKQRDHVAAEHPEGANSALQKLGQVRQNHYAALPCIVLPAPLP